MKMWSFSLLALFSWGMNNMRTVNSSSDWLLLHTDKHLVKYVMLLKHLSSRAKNSNLYLSHTCHHTPTNIHTFTLGYWLSIITASFCPKALQQLQQEQGGANLKTEVCMPFLEVGQKNIKWFDPSGLTQLTCSQLPSGAVTLWAGGTAAASGPFWPLSFESHKSPPQRFHPCFWKVSRLCFHSAATPSNFK